VPIAPRSLVLLAAVAALAALPLQAAALPAAGHAADQATGQAADQVMDQAAAPTAPTVDQAAGRTGDQAAEQVTRTIEVGIQDYRFEPAELRIEVGTTVKWVNLEKRTSHSVLFTGKDSVESERMFPGEFWERRFDKPGIYLYTCGPHPEMQGRIEVIESARSE
jgi:plastocyanin